MANDIQYPLVNGMRHDWSSVSVKIGDDTFTGVKEVKYSDSLVGTKVKGTHPRAIARTRGEYDCDGSLIVYTAEAAAIRKALHDKGQSFSPVKGYKEVEFDIVVSYDEGGFDTITDTLTDCRIQKDEGGGTQGADPLTVNLELSVMEVFWNGISSLGRSLTDLPR